MKTKLIPVDKTRCQALISNGHSFMSFGGTPEYVQCSKRPNVIITEKKLPKGKMSLCSTCLANAIALLGDTFTIRQIKRKTKS